MKKTPISNIPGAVSEEIRSILGSTRIYDSSCSPEARVYFIDQGNGLYLKTAAAGTLASEAKMAAFFHHKALGPEVLAYFSDQRDWLVTAAVQGEDCVASQYLSNPQKLCDTIAQELRRLHEVDNAGCPVPDRTAVYLAQAEQGFFQGRFDVTLFPEGVGPQTAEQAYELLEQSKGNLRSDTLIHGDYCLPNIVLRDWKLAGFIDVGCGGVGDRHIDLFWGLWTLEFNLKTNAYRDRFLDAYGRDRVDESLLEAVAAAERFG